MCNRKRGRCPGENKARWAVYDQWCWGCTAALSLTFLKPRYRICSSLREKRVWDSSCSRPSGRWRTADSSSSSSTLSAELNICQLVVLMSLNLKCLITLLNIFFFHFWNTANNARIIPLLFPKQNMLAGKEHKFLGNLLNNEDRFLNEC